MTRGLAGAVRAGARPATAPRRLRRTIEAWPLAVIALGGVLTLLWASVLAWATLRFAVWLI